MSLESFGTVGFVLFLSYWLTGRLCSPTSRFYLLDRPNERSLHAEPTVRTGGLAILSSLLIGVVTVQLASMILAEPQVPFWAAQGSEEILWILGIALLLGATSFWNDHIGLPPSIRLAIHGMAAVGVITQFSGNFLGTIPG